MSDISREALGWAKAYTEAAYHGTESVVTVSVEVMQEVIRLAEIGLHAEEDE